MRTCCGLVVRQNGAYCPTMDQLVFRIVGGQNLISPSRGMPVAAREWSLVPHIDM